MKVTYPDQLVPSEKTYHHPEFLKNEASIVEFDDKGLK